MTTLAQINETLIANQQLAEDTNKNISEMKVGILGFFDFEKRKRLDDLEDRREQKKNQAATINSNNNNTEGDKESGGFNLGNFLSGLTFGNLLKGMGKIFGLGFLARLLGLKGKGKFSVRGGIFGFLAMMFADEIADGVYKLTGSDFAASLTEAGIVGGGLGAIFGPKGIILGAMAGIIVTSAKALGDYVEEELKKKDVDWAPILGEAAKATTNIAGFATVGGLVLGPFGAIAGALIGGSVSLFQTFERYQNDPVFKKLVDTKASQIKKTIEDTIIDAGNLLLDALDTIAPDLITTQSDGERYRLANPEQAQLLDDTQATVNRLAKQQTDATLNPGRVTMSDDDKLELKTQIALLEKLRAERNAFLKNDSAVDSKIDAGNSSRGRSYEDIAAPKQVQTLTAGQMITYVAEKREKQAGIGMISGNLLTAGSKAAERMLESQLGVSDMNAAKKLAKEMNMTLIEYLENYKTVAKPSITPTMVDNSVTTTGESNTTILGQGSSTRDMNDPIYSRLSLSGL